MKPNKVRKVSKKPAARNDRKREGPTRSLVQAPAPVQKDRQPEVWSPKADEISAANPVKSIVFLTQLFELLERTSTRVIALLVVLVIVVVSLVTKMGHEIVGGFFDDLLSVLAVDFLRHK